MDNRNYHRGALIPISVLIPTIRKTDIASCLLSIALSSATPAEILIYNNGEDITGNYMVRQYCSLLHHQGAKIKITYEPEKKGIGYARHWLITHAENELILFIDDDVFVTTDTIQQLYMGARANPNHGWIAPAVLMTENAVNVPNFVDQPMTLEEILERGKRLHASCPFVYSWNNCSEVIELQELSNVAPTCCVLIRKYRVSGILDTLKQWNDIGEDEIITNAAKPGLYDLNATAFHIPSFDQERIWAIGNKDQSGERGWITQ